MEPDRGFSVFLYNRPLTTKGSTATKINKLAAAETMTR